MFSYRHAFHAGNHADVLKHSILTRILLYYTQKDTAFYYIDPHAGAGLYSLESAWATKTAEFVQGAQKLWSEPRLPALLADYVAILRKMNPDGRLRVYPGSPWLAMHVLREQDRLRLFELHPNEINILLENLRRFGRTQQRRVQAQATDGFNALKAHLPPPSRRAVILIDPPYEDKHDYRRVVTVLKDAVKRFATGCYVVWYPILSRRECQQLVAQLRDLPVKNWLDVQLSVDPLGRTGRRTRGSGVFVINPPYTLKAELDTALPWLARHLGFQNQGTCGVEARVPTSDTTP